MVEGAWMDLQYNNEQNDIYIGSIKEKTIYLFN